MAKIEIPFTVRPAELAATLDCHEFRVIKTTDDAWILQLDGVPEKDAVAAVRDYTPPPSEPAAMPVADWIELWPQAKRVAAYRAAQTDDTIADGLMLLQAQATVKLRGHGRTEAFMAYVVSAGYLTGEEAENLLDGLPADSERP